MGYWNVLLSNVGDPSLFHKGRNGLRPMISWLWLLKNFHVFRNHALTPRGEVLLASMFALLFFLLWPLTGSWVSPLEPWGARSDMPTKRAIIPTPNIAARNLSNTCFYKTVSEKKGISDILQLFWHPGKCSSLTKPQTCCNQNCRNGPFKHPCTTRGMEFESKPTLYRLFTYVLMF